MATDLQIAADRSWPALVDAAQRALEEARSLDEVSAVLDRAKSLQRMTKRVAAAREAHNRCGEIVIYALRRLGEELARTEKAKGGRPIKTGSAGEPVFAAPTLAEMGVSKKASHTAQLIAAIPEPALREYIEDAKLDGEVTTAGALRLAQAPRDESDDRPPAEFPLYGPVEKMTKPPYRIPSMAEIATVPRCGFKVASAFSGAGGSCLGYRMAGFEVVWASEFIEAAQDTYRANMSAGTILDTRDIRTVQPEDILQATGLKVGELDLFDGSPPCCSFSTAGKRQKDWGRVKKYSDTEQRTDDLFFEFARLLQGLQPKTFVAENVSGLVKGVSIGHFDKIHAALESCGYLVDARLLDAQWLGTPQMRQRIIFVGVRKDLGLRPAHPKPLSYNYSIADACPWVTGEGTHPPVEPESWMKGKTGDEWDRIGGCGKSLKYFQLVRPDPNRPCPTVTAAGGNPGLASVAHPNEKRKFSIAELKRICGFPDDFVLTGSYAKAHERLGRAVPPTMMKAVAETVRDEILMKAVRPASVGLREAA
jgi:DNA (cytosine-5)-methyltransferase 1